MSLPTRPDVVEPVALSAIARLVAASPPRVDTLVTGVCLRSASVRPGDLYAALPGARTHGARYVEQARSAGAVAVLTDEAGAAITADAAQSRGLATVVVDDPRAVLGAVASFVYGSPATSFTLVGVTGTQGKTTTTQLLAAGLAASGRRTAVVGTIGTWIDGEQVKTSLTTPEAPDLHAMFAVMREREVEVCAMEVSSHSLVLGRVDGVVFDVAVFVNFGRDHLDFHDNVESYFAAKASMFTPDRARRALLNADDERVVTLGDRLQIPTRTFSAAGGPATWRCRDVALRATGSEFVLVGPDRQPVPVTIRLPGDFNVANALAALAAIGEAGFDVPGAAAGLAQVETVSGRVERVEGGQPFTVLVDYAHKPDAVRAVLLALRPVTVGRLWIVLGAGGDRDHGKRVLMGAAAAELADVVVVTDDNPRTEDPTLIRSALLAGARDSPTVPSAEVVEVPGRREAITHALAGARRGDTVLVAGKGHESGQEVAGEVLPFDDRVVVREVLADLAGTGWTG